MSKFTKSITRTYDFEDDTVTVTMNRLKRKHALKLIPHIGEPDEDGRVVMNLDESMEFMDLAAGMLTQYITSMVGLVDDEGAQISVDDAFGEEAESYFIQLASDIMSDLMEASFIKPKDEKKSDKLPKNISEVSATQSTSTSAV